MKSRSFTSKTNFSVGLISSLGVPVHLLLNLSSWIRKQRWLQVIYRRFPASLRNLVLLRVSEVAKADLIFPKSGAWPLSVPGGMMSLETKVADLPEASRQAGAVNLLGYMRGQFGLAESARLYARALLACRAQVSIVDIDINLPHGWNDLSLDVHIGCEAPHDISIVFVNPDCLDAAFQKIGRERIEGRYIIGCWFWELEDVPAEWIPYLDEVDEVMVASEFVELAFRKVTSKPILRVPLPVSIADDSSLQRSDFDLPDDSSFVFLCTFDFNSWLDRKNPLAVLDAFVKAFPPERNDVFLLVKTSNGYRYPEKLLELLNAAAGDKRILVRDQVIDAGHLRALQRCCDAYVSLHRAEGFGLGIAECMAMGKPVIATAWSGNMEFMNAENSLLVDYALVPVLEGQYPHVEGAVWAEASTDMAAAHMRQLVASPLVAAEIGERGRRAILTALAPKLAGERIIRRCIEIEGMRNRSQQPPVSVGVGDGCGSLSGNEEHGSCSHS